MPAYNLASFPNSRIYPRAATTRVVSGPDVSVLPETTGPSPGGNTQIAPVNLNRTYFTIYNTGPDALRINRDDAPITFAAEIGFLIPADGTYDCEGPEPIYGATVAAGTADVSTEEGTA
jgi:hypothetical protein